MTAAVTPRRCRRNRRGHRHAAGGDHGSGRHPGLGHHSVAARRLQLPGSTKGQVVARLDRRCSRPRSIRPQATVERLQADVERARVTLEDAQVKLRRADELMRSAADSRDGPRDRRVDRAAGARLAEGGAGAGHAGARLAQPEPGQSRPLDHHRAGRRHRDLAQRRRRPDGGGEHVGADALRHREGPDARCR